MAGKIPEPYAHRPIGRGRERGERERGERGREREGGERERETEGGGEREVQSVICTACMTEANAVRKSFAAILTSIGLELGRALTSMISSHTIARRERRKQDKITTTMGAKRGTDSFAGRCGPQKFRVYAHTISSE